MDFSPIYLLNRFFYRLYDFFHHWYVDGSRWFGRRAMAAFTKLDRTFAVKVTLEHLFEPLYKDYTVMGRILGAIFRTLRVLVGFVVYAIVAVAILSVYIAWLAIPAYVVWRIIKG
jgi:tryptophan-rich sensory protein